MTFSVTAKPTVEELAEAVNYLLSNFSQTMAINPNTGQITTASFGVVSYLYKYLHVRYADSYDGTVNFSNVPTNRLYYGVNNSEADAESLTAADYLWLPVTGGFGTDKFFWYNTTGGRQIETFIGQIKPSPNFVKDNGNAIDLDLLTTAAEDKTDPVVVDQSAYIKALEEAIGSIPQPQLGTMAPVNIDWVPYIGFDTAPPWIGTTAGQFWFDSTTGSFNAKMGNNNITQQVGEEFFRYGKASAAISDVNLQLIYKTGVVGASGVITFAPTIAGITDPDQIIGIATESLAINTFGRVTTAGIVHGVDTTGSVYGETWADNDDIWYNPVTGGLTKTKPVAPNIKLQIGTIINAGSGGSGSFSVKLGASSALGGTDSNVQLTSLANKDLLQYDTTLGYWKNVSLSFVGFVTNVTGTSPVVSSGGVTPAISLASGYGDTQNPYASKTANYVLAAPNGSAGAPTFRGLVAADIPALSYVSSIGVTAPITSTGGLTPTIGITQAGTASNGYLSSTDWNTFNNKQGVSAPVTKTADFSVSNGDLWLINNKSGSTCTATLPVASSFSGRVLHFQNYQTQALVSASSNVVPIAGGAAGTSILLASSGDSATLVSDGTNWLMTQYVPNNILLLE